MRRCKSYSIVDHQLFHGGYLNHLGHKSLALYLFFIVVSDKNGKSFYSTNRIAQILRLNQDDLNLSLLELSKYGLIEYHPPNFWVKELENNHNPILKQEQCSNEKQQSCSYQPKPSKDISARSLSDIFKSLRGEDELKSNRRPSAPFKNASECRFNLSLKE